MKFRNISIKWQFILIITLVAMPFIILSFFSLGEEKHKEVERAKELAINTARNIGIQQKGTEASTRQMLSLLTKLPELQVSKPDSNVLDILFKTVLSQNPQFAVILAAIPNGNIYAAAMPFKSFSIIDRKYFKDVMRSRSFAVGEFAKSRLTNRAVLHYAMPVLDNNNNVKLILIASFDLAQYQNILSVSSLPNESDFAFYDFSGRMLYNSRNQNLIGKRGSSEIQKAVLSTSDEGWYIAQGEDGQKRLFGFARINIEKESPYMYIVVSTPISEAFRNANIAFLRSIILIILAVVFSLIISLYYKNYLFRNIDQLVNIANKLKEGDLMARSNIDYSAGETGTLAMALDKMADSLMEREKEKDAVNKNLKVLTERFEIAVNSARIGIWEWDLLTHKVYWDKQMFELYHLDPLDFKGTIHDWMKKLHPEDSVRFEEELHHSIRHKKTTKTSFRIKVNQKSFKNIRCYYNIIADNSGKALRVTGVNRDITERILLENELTRTKDGVEKKVMKLKNQLETTISTINEKTDEILSDFESDSLTTKEIKEQLQAYCNGTVNELTSILRSL